MNPQTAAEHLRTGRYLRTAELVEAFWQALDQLEQARTERDSLAAALSVANVAGLAS